MLSKALHKPINGWQNLRMCVSNNIAMYLEFRVTNFIILAFGAAINSSWDKHHVADVE